MLKQTFKYNLYPNLAVGDAIFIIDWLRGLASIFFVMILFA